MARISGRQPARACGTSSSVARSRARSASSRGFCDVGVAQRVGSRSQAAAGAGRKPPARTAGRVRPRRGRRCASTRSRLPRAATGRVEACSPAVPQDLRSGSGPTAMFPAQQSWAALRRRKPVRTRPVDDGAPACADRSSGPCRASDLLSRPRGAPPRTVPRPAATGRFDAAIAAHRAGRLDEALTLYDQAIARGERRVRRLHQYRRHPAHAPTVRRRRSPPTARRWSWRPDDPRRPGQSRQRAQG